MSKIDMYLIFSACTIENNINYAGAGVGVDTPLDMPDAHACQAFCKLNNQPFFTWTHTDHGVDPAHCFCKSTDSGRATGNKATSGVAHGCGGGKLRKSNVFIAYIGNELELLTVISKINVC